MTAAQSHIATCIRDTARFLAQEASEAGLVTLAYLLDMTAMEAEEAHLGAAAAAAESTRSDPLSDAA